MKRQKHIADNQDKKAQVIQTDSGVIQIFDLGENETSGCL